MKPSDVASFRAHLQIAFESNPVYDVKRLP
jgi:hypothetical protein